jgi:Rps23 Pro-64 3,4-dihydroxylase Tpa1-like proline 4-hydroxylase
MLKTGSFSPNQLSYHNGPEYRSMIMHLDMEHPLMQELAHIIYPHIDEPEKYELERVYANATSFADVPLPHTDSDTDNDLTVLYYANSEWLPEYGGETVFFNSVMDIFSAVVPRPGRFVIFNSGIKHCPRIQNRLAPIYRLTIAFKLSRRVM